MLLMTSVFDNLDRLVGRELAVGGTNVLKSTWSFDAAGDLATQTKSAWVSGAWSTVGTSALSFDGLGRQTGIMHKAGGGTTVGDYAYAYDAGDRITSQTIDGTATNYSYDNT